MKFLTITLTIQIQYYNCFYEMAISLNCYAELPTGILNHMQLA